MRIHGFRRCLSLLTVTFLLMCLPLAVGRAETALVDLSGVKTAFIAEATSGQLVMEKNSSEKANVAGLTRLPALLLVCELVDEGALEPTTEVTISEAAAAVKGPTAFVEAYEKIAAGELLKAAIMIGAGDAIYALAEAATGSSGAFAEQMNERLAELGVSATYTNITDDGVLLSAAELAAIGREIIRSATFRNYATVYMDEIVHENGSATELVNSNRMIRNSTGCGGVGTGSSDAAGYCGVFWVLRGDTGYICVVTGAQNSNARFTTAQAMVEYAFGAYKTVTLSKTGQILVENVPVKGGAEMFVSLAARNDNVLLLKQNEEYQEKRNVPETLYAPLLQTDVVGTLEYTDGDGNLIALVELVPHKEIAQAGLSDFIQMLFLSFLHA